MKLLSTVTKIIFSRISVCAIGIILQATYLAVLFWTLGTMFSYSYFIFQILGILTALYIMNSETSPAYKPIWVFTVLSLPILGCMFYLFYGKKKSRYHKAINTLIRNTLIDEETAESLLQSDVNAAKQAHYIRRNGIFRIYSNTQTVYFPSGEAVFPEIIKAIRSAETFIFMEFFIIEDGIMWSDILRELEKKARSGIDVRIIYDDMGCLLTLPRDYYNQLKEKGIQCRVFGRIKPLWISKMNNRDHRKILVCDGTTAFTGGINLADEYINAYEKHGYWKDSAVMLKGEASSAFTVMFLDLWNKLSDRPIPCPDKYLFSSPTRATGYVIPYCDSPEDDELLGENIYINMINSAERYVYITTPYLILDSEIREALILASKNGIDIRIITPHIPDKRFVYEVTQANYHALIKHGIRIYEFQPGFIHAKNFISDDKTAVVGTINLDYRSIYLHHECGVWMHGTDSIKQIREDFIRTLDQSREISLKDINETNIFRRIIRSVLMMLSPMM